LENVHKEAVKKFGEEPLTGVAEQRYQSVLGQLALGSTFKSRFVFLLKTQTLQEQQVHHKKTTKFN